jgi:hypothetical protein
MATRLSALRTGRTLLPRNIIFLYLVLISVRGSMNPSASCGRKDYKCNITGFKGLDGIEYPAVVTSLNVLSQNMTAKGRDCRSEPLTMIPISCPSEALKAWQEGTILSKDTPYRLSENGILLVPLQHFSDTQRYEF